MPIEETTFERHLSVEELALLWGMSDDFVRRLFLSEPDVVVFYTNRPGRRVYRTLRIPESVALRVHRRMQRLEQSGQASFGIVAAIFLMLLIVAFAGQAFAPSLLAAMSFMLAVLAVAFHLTNADRPAAGEETPELHRVAVVQRNGGWSEADMIERGEGPWRIKVHKGAVAQVKVDAHVPPPIVVPAATQRVGQQREPAPTASSEPELIEIGEPGWRVKVRPTPQKRHEPAQPTSTFSELARREEVLPAPRVSPHELINASEVLRPSGDHHGFVGEVLYRKKASQITQTLQEQNRAAEQVVKLAEKALAFSDLALRKRESDYKWATFDEDKRREAAEKQEERSRRRVELEREDQIAGIRFRLEMEKLEEARTRYQLQTSQNRKKLEELQAARTETLKDQLIDQAARLRRKVRDEIEKAKAVETYILKLTAAFTTLKRQFPDQADLIDQHLRQQTMRVRQNGL